MGRGHTHYFCPLTPSSPSSVSALERPSHQDASQWRGASAARGRLCHLPILPQEGGDLRAQVRHGGRGPEPPPRPRGRRRLFIRRGTGSGARTPAMESARRFSPASHTGLLTSQAPNCVLSLRSARRYLSPERLASVRREDPRSRTTSSSSNCSAKKEG